MSVEFEIVEKDTKSWKKIYEFIYNSDDRRYLFVINQLRRMLGGKIPLRRNQRMILNDRMRKKETQKMLDRITE